MWKLRVRKLKTSLHALADACVRITAVLGVVSLVMGLMSSRWNGTNFWQASDLLPAWAVSALLVLFAAALLFGRRIHPAGGFLAYCIGVLLAVACLADAFIHFRAAGGIGLGDGVPASLLVGALLLLWIATAGDEPYASESRTRRALWLRVVDRTSR